MNSAPDSGAASPPARWLVAVLVGGLFAAALALGLWFEREREANKPSLGSGQPGFAAEFLLDPAGALTFDRIQAGAGTFAPLIKRVSSLQARYVWYRLTIDNDTGEVRRAILGLSKDFIQEATFYESGHPVQIAGGVVRWSERSVPSPKPAFAVELPARSRTRVYVRVNDTIKQPEGFLLWNDRRVFARWVDLYEFEFVGYCSLWIGLVAYNGFLYAILRRRDYLLYLFYVLSVGALVVAGSDLSVFFLSWPHGALRGIVITVLLNLTSFNLVQFSRVFLETLERAPRLDRWLRRAGWAVIISSLAAPAWIWPASAPVCEVFAFGLNIVVLMALPACGLTLCLRRSPQAGFYVLAFFPPIGGLVYILGTNLGIPEERANSFPVLCASALELILLAVALAWRNRRIADEAGNLRSEYLARLENDVARRTRELSETNEFLARANQDKDRIFGIIAHDLRGPAQSLFTLANLLTESPSLLSTEESAALAKDIEEVCQTQLELLENLLQWGRMQSNQVSSKPTPQAAIDAITAATAMLAHAARNKGIKLSVDVEPGLSLYADPQGVQAIVRNLLGNAIKFTPSGGQVSVTAKKQGNSAEVSVKDNGTGMSANRLDQIMAGPVPSLSGTRSERGAGIGLTLCFDLARSNGGSLKIISAPGQGTTAVLTLPA